MTFFSKGARPLTGYVRRLYPVTRSSVPGGAHSRPRWAGGTSSRDKLEVWLPHAGWVGPDEDFFPNVGTFLLGKFLEANFHSPTRHTLRPRAQGGAYVLSATHDRVERVKPTHMRARVTYEAF